MKNYAGVWKMDGKKGLDRLSEREVLKLSPLALAGALSIRWEIDQDHVGAFFDTSEDYFFPIRRDIEIADEKLSVEVG